MQRGKWDYQLIFLAQPHLLGGRDLYQVIEEAILGGVSIVLLSLSGYSDYEFYVMAMGVKDITRKYGTKLIIHHRMDIAMAVGADGVHIEANDMPISIVRSWWKGVKTIGFTARTIDQALLAQRQGADYILVGPIFSDKDDGWRVSLETVGQMKAALKLPVVLYGGIKNEYLKIIQATGVDGVVMGEEITSRLQITHRVKEIKELLFKIE